VESTSAYTSETFNGVNSINTNLKSPQEFKKMSKRLDTEEKFGEMSDSVKSATNPFDDICQNTRWTGIGAKVVKNVVAFNPWEVFQKMCKLLCGCFHLRKM